MFTDRQIDNLRPKKTRYEVVEGNTGLVVRVSPTGVKTFSLTYRFAGKPRRLTLGVYRPAGLVAARTAVSHDLRGVPFVTLAQARVRLAEARRQRDSGVDPGAQAVAAHQAERQAETVAELCSIYLERYAKVSKRESSWRRDQWQLEKDVLPAWGSRKATSITRRDVIALLDDMVARGAPVQANRMVALLSKMFRFAVRRDMIQFSPVIEIDRPGKETVRDRAPDDNELRLIWKASETLEPPDRQFVQLLVLLGQRRGEVAGVQAREIDVSDHWLIPAAKMKGKVAQLVPLPKLAVDIIASAPRGRPWAGSDYVLASRRLRGKHVGNFHLIKRRLEAAIRQLQIEEAGRGPVPPPLAEWTWHDLRRSFSSGMARLGVDEEVRERLLAHVPAKLKRTYQVYSFALEKRRALELWAAHLQEITSSPPTAKIVTMRRR